MPPSKRWALVTGVSEGGMGDGHMRAFLNRGVNVIATAMDVELLSYLERDDDKYGASLAHVQLDVASDESIKQAVEEIGAITGGRLDWLMNNAGYGYYMPLMDVDIEKAKKQYDVNVWGLFAVTQACFPMLKAAKGTVVNQSSMAGVQGFNRPYMGIYSSSKAAVYSLSDCMRVELAPFDIKVVTLVTGSVKTEFFNNKEGGRTVLLPDSSVYSPIRKQVETMMAGSLSGPKARDRLDVTRSTVVALMRSYMFRTRFVRRGYMTIKMWLTCLLLPTWLVDRWARKSGGLDQLRKILKAR